MRRTLVVLASSALMFPAAVLASPAEAASEATTTIKNCSKTKYGVTVRIKLRDNGRFTRVRVSHPRGEGNFREPKVGRVDVSSSGGDEWRDRMISVGPSFRLPSASGPGALAHVSGDFRLTNGHKITLGCRAGN